jgi:hypothetical protein
MAMRTATPWWASLVFGIGLLLFLLGERFFGHLSGVRFFLTGLGLLLILAITAARAWAMMSSSGARRRVERTLLFSHLGTIFGLILYALSTDWGLAKLNLSETGTTHFHGAITVLFLAVLIASNVPLLMMELSLGLALRTAFDVRPTPGAASEDAGVEYFRVREIGWSGLSLGLALSFLMVTCNVANDRNVQRDVSYFKTSAPGDATQKIVATSSEPIKALLFFPDPNGVKDQVKTYLDTLASKTKKLTVEQRDRLSSAELANKYRVTKDGMIVFVRGTGDKEKWQTLEIDTDLARARTSTGKLRNLDREVNSLLLKLVRDKRKAYLMVGHGEMNDPDSIPPELKGRIPERRTSVFRRRLADLNFDIKNLTLLDLSRDVPEDATVVFAMAPSLPLQPAEWAALGRYLDRGGALFFALDPKGEAGLGPLEAKLGFKMIQGDLTDEVSFLPQRGMMTDRRFVISTQFSAHASTTSLSRSVDKGLILIDSGALEELPAAKDGPKRVVTIRSMDSSFLDKNDNFAFDVATEKKQRWNLAAAIEGFKVGDKDGFRTLLFADVDLFADVFVQGALGRATAIMVSGPLLEDSVKWLGGEEAIVGDVVSEDDKAIQHTKNEDVVWFTLMIIGAPIIVLTLGLVGTWARRRRGSRKTEVTQ